jgi:hypothetical protein
MERRQFEPNGVLQGTLVSWTRGSCIAPYYDSNLLFYTHVLGPAVDCTWSSLQKLRALALG